jgi:uncharacterized phiE125 gp8 family phage protein
MSWQVESIDRTTLPAALLPTVKDHCRVTFADDDNILKVYTSVAVAQLEKVWGFPMYAVSGVWLPEVPTLVADMPDGVPPYKLPTPITPASSFTSKDADGVDNTAAFRLINKGQIELPNYLATVNGSTFPAGVEVALVGGYAAEADMPPEALGAVLQVTARLYEFRENVQSFSVNLMPMWLNDLLVGLWQPRA